MSRANVPPWSAPVAVHGVPDTGRRVDLVADQNTRTAVAEAIGLRALPRLEASFDVSRHGREGLRVVGRVSATIGQTCVVTLEPIDNEIEEAVDLVFAPVTASEPSHESSVRSRVAADDAPEPLVGGVVDLGVVATEFLTLGIDPYPRKSGVAFTAPAAGDDSSHPFAALAALKKGQGGA
jgi:Large ribosomal RNA subunit accumulation protein YceD